MTYKQITQEEAYEIIETRKPFGKFWHVDEESGAFVGVDNTGEEVLFEDFMTQKECFEWLARNMYQDVLKAAIKTFGEEKQKVVAIEELSELQKELTKDIRGKGSKDRIMLEIADVEIMLEQIKIMHGIKEHNLDAMKTQQLNKLFGYITAAGGGTDGHTL